MMVVFNVSIHVNVSACVYLDICICDYMYMCMSTETSGNSSEPEKNFVWIGPSSGASLGFVPIIVVLFYYLSGLAFMTSLSFHPS